MGTGFIPLQRLLSLGDHGNDQDRKAESWTGSAEWELWMNFANPGRCIHFSTINHHETPHRPQDRLRIQGIARLGGKPQSAGAFPQCSIGRGFDCSDNRSGDSQSLQRQGISG